MFTKKSFFTYLLKKNIRRPKTSSLQQPRVLFITYDAIGDMAMTIPLFNALRKNLPSWKFEVLSSPRNYDLVKDHPAFSHVWKLDINRSFGKLDDEEKKQLKMLYKQEYDFLIYLGERINSSTLWRISHLCANERLSLPFTEKTCLHKGIDPLKSHLFDRYIGLSYDEEVHMCRRMLSILPDLGIHIPSEVDLTLHLRPIQLPQIAISTDKPHILLNPNGSRDNNTLSENQVKTIIKQLQKLACEIYLFDTLENRSLTKNMAHSIQWLPSANIIMATQWLNEMDLIVTTDTSIGHLAAAQSRPTIMVRTKGPNCCEPLSTNVQMLRSQSDNIKELSVDLIVQAVKQKLDLRA